jgi:hypothetical protein
VPVTSKAAFEKDMDLVPLLPIVTANLFLSFNKIIYFLTTARTFVPQSKYNAGRLQLYQLTADNEGRLDKKQFELRTAIVKARAQLVHCA